MYNNKSSRYSTLQEENLFDLFANLAIKVTNTLPVAIG